MRPSHAEVRWREPEVVLLRAGLPRRGLLFRKDESDWGQVGGGALWSRNVRLTSGCPGAQELCGSALTSRIVLLVW